MKRSMEPDLSKILKKILKDLSSTQTQHILRACKVLKFKFLKRCCTQDVVQVFCESDGVKILVSNLFTICNEDLFDLILSMLANICVENETARNQIIKANGIKAIERILDGLQKQSILDRACRLLGNLLKDPASYSSLLENLNSVAAVVDYLKVSIKANLNNSIKSGLRTLRYVAKITSEYATEIINQKLLYEIAEYIKSAKYSLYEPILNLLRDLSQTCSEYSFHEQVLGSGLLPIVVKFSSNKSSTLRNLSLSFLVNQSPYIAEQIGNAGGIPAIIEGIKNISDVDIKRIDLIEALCRFLYHANNRHRMNQHEGFQCLMKSFECDNDDDEIKCCQEIIVKTLLQCLYDDVNMVLLQDLNIVPCLLSQLDNFVKKNSGIHKLCEDGRLNNKIDLSVFDVCAEDIESLSQENGHYDNSGNGLFDRGSCEEEKEQEQEEFSVNSPSYQMILDSQNDNFGPATKTNSSSKVGFSPRSNGISPDMSPSSSTYSPLGCISPVSPSSPMSIASDISSCFDDLQDLVYSDHEEDAKNSDLSSGGKKRKLTSDFKNWGKQRRKSGTDIKMSSEIGSSKKRKAREGKRPTDNQIIMDSIFAILAKFTWKVDNKPIPKCVIDYIPRYFEIFLSFITNVPMELTTLKYGHSVRPFYSACKTLCRIASDFECFEKIIMCCIPKLIQKLSESLEHEDEECEQCFILRRFCRKILERDLRTVAESRIGQSKLTKLMSTTSGIGVQVAQVLSSLISARSILKKFHVNHELIGKILGSVEDPQSDMFDDSIRSIMHLAKNLGIKHTKSGCDDEKLPVKCLYDGKGDLFDVWFVMADGEKVGARKSALLNTDFFRAMFCGNFSETDQSNITVEDASLEAFSLMMHYLHCDSVPCDGSVELMLDHRAVLELLQLADKHLLKDLQYSLHDQIIQFIDEENASNVFCAASLIQDEYLIFSSLRFILAGNLSIQPRIKCMAKLMASDNKDNAQHFIKKLLCDQIIL